MTNDTANRLLARVKELREARKLSQEQFAEKAGLGYKYYQHIEDYQHIEAGRRRDIRLSTLEKLATACGVKLPDLLDFEHQPLALSEEQSGYDEKGSSVKAKAKGSKSPGAKKPAKARGA